MWSRNEEEEEKRGKKRLLAARDYKCTDIMNATEAKNRMSNNVNIGEDVVIEVPDTAHQIGSGL